MKNLFRLFLIVAFLGAGAVAQAQQAKKTPRIGVLLAASRSALAERLDAFRQGLRDLGYVEGQNIVIEYRYAEGNFDRLPDLAAELIRLKVEVIVAAGGGPAVRAAKNATKSIPIVMTGITDPVAGGFITSLARPGGNITGLSLGGYGLSGKRLEILKETVPKISRVAVFSIPAGASDSEILKEMRAAASALRLEIRSLEVRSPDDFTGAFQAAVKGGSHAFTVSTSPVFTANRNRVLEFGAKNRLPAVYPWREYVEDGGLMSYAASSSDLYRRAATYVDKILKGRTAADLPVEQPMKFEFIINLKAAKQIGVTIPQWTLMKADKVIR
jgi:putative ABC transport system substrate-binding protein